MDKNFKRIIENEIVEGLESMGAISIVGVKNCGKTFVSNKYAKSNFYIQNKKEQNKILFDTNSDFIMLGDKPRLIDEWQLIPRIWDLTKFWIDRKKEFGLFILTDSVTIDRSKISHSGAGRILPIKMSTMTLYETKDSDGSISLKDLFDNKEFKNSVSNKTINDVAYYICRGGWPEIISSNTQNLYNNVLKGYIKSIIKFENDYNLEKVPNNIKAFDKIIDSLARLNTTQVKLSTVTSDIENEISRNYVSDYINFLKKIYVIEELNVWKTKNYRSKSKLLTTPKLYFCDSSIGLYKLNINPNNIFEDMNTFGLYFENLVIHDLRVYAQSIDGEIYFYRDENGFEIDCIIELRDGRWAAIEVKLNTNQVETAANNLFRFKDKIDKNKPPSFLAVITASNICYKREDGIYVIPITCLKN